MTYLLQSSDCHFVSPGQILPVDIFYSLNKGVKYISFKMKAPEDAIYFLLHGFAAPTWSKSISITTSKHPLAEDSYYYSEITVTMTVKEDSDMYRGTTGIYAGQDVMVHAGTMYLIGYDTDVSYLEVEAVDRLFVGEVNYYAVVHTDGIGIGANEFTSISGMISYGTAVTVDITDVTKDKVTVTTNEEVTFTAVYTGTEAKFTWSMGGDVIWVSGKNLSHATVKFNKPGTYSIVCTASNYNSTDIITKESFIIVTVPAIVGVNEEVNFYPNDVSEPTRISNLNAPARIKFMSVITGVYQQITWNIYDKSKAIVEGGGQTAIQSYVNVLDIEYLFLAPKTYTVELNVTYSESVTRTVRYEYIVQSAYINVEEIYFAQGQNNVPAYLSIQAENVVYRTSITQYAWEYGINGVFWSDTNIAQSQLESTIEGMISTPVAGTNIYGHNVTLPQSSSILIEDPGILSLRLYYWDNNDNFSTYTFRNVATFNATGTPVPYFIDTTTFEEPHYGNIPFTVTFDATETVDAVTLEWNFGDTTIVSGLYSVMKNISHEYTVANIYDVTLTATNAIGTVSFVRPTSVIALNTAIPYIREALLSTSSGPLPYDITESVYYGNTPLNMTLNLEQSANCTGFEIYWGDDEQTIDEGPTPSCEYTHTYSQNGSYIITIIGKNGTNEISLTLDPIKVYSVPIAYFDADVVEILSGQSVQFINYSLNDPDQWLWNFGDGATSIEENPVHTYLVDGVYPVSLTAINRAGSHTFTKSSYIVVGIGSNLEGDFSAAPGTTFILADNPSVDVTFTFTGVNDESYSYLWNFGDGNFSNVFESTHTYTTFGVFPVSFTITHILSGISRTITKSQYITVTQSNAPTPDFELLGGTTTGPIPFAVTVVPRCTGAEPTQYRINWGDSPYDVIYQAVDTASMTHTYTEVGKYDILFVASNQYGSNEIIKTDYIDATLGGGPPPTPVVIPVPSHNNATPLSGQIPLSIMFIDATTELHGEVITSWTWTFGDGTTSSQKNPNHTYANPGTYYVMLKLGAMSGANYYAPYPLVVEATPIIDVPHTVIPDFSSYLRIGSVPFTTTLFSTSQNNPIEFAWLFGDEPAGTPFPAFSSSAGVVTHRYNASGVYDVKMKARNALGEVTCTKDNYIVVSEPVTQIVSVAQSKPSTIGDVYVQTINNIDPTGTNKMHEIENVNTMDSYVYSIPSVIEDLVIEGSLYSDGKTEDEYAEDVKSLRYRSGAYNYIDIAGERGFIEIESISIPKDAEQQTIRDYTINGKYMSATMYERVYTLETSMYNSVINGQQYTVDHPPTIALPINAFNVKIKSPWQTVTIKEPAYEMVSSEGKIPIYMPFELMTADYSNMNKTSGTTIQKSLLNNGFGQIYISPRSQTWNEDVTFNVLIGSQVPRGKYKVGMKLSSVKTNTSPQNVPESCHFECLGYSLTDDTIRVVTSPAAQKISVTYDGLYISEEIDVTNYNERLQIKITNPRIDARLIVDYVFLIPTYHARIAFDAPSEYYSGEVKVYDYYNGSAKRIYNVNHEFKGVMYFCNPFIRWVIDPKQMWRNTGDITHTSYSKNPATAPSTYVIDDELNKGMQLFPLAYSETRPNIILKKLLPNIIELEMVYEHGYADYNADDSRVITTVHIVPYAFKFYCNHIGEIQYTWQLTNKYGYPTFSYFAGTIMTKYSDDYIDNDLNNSGYIHQYVNTAVVNYNDYLYILSFNEEMKTHFSYINNNLAFPALHKKGAYQFTLSVLPLYTDKRYNYSDNLVCVNEDMQHLVQHTVKDKDIEYSSLGGNTTNFWTMFSVIEGFQENVTLELDRFTVSHTNVYAKNMATERYVIQDKAFKFFKLDFDLSMHLPSPSYIPKIAFKCLESNDKDTYVYVEIFARTTNNVKLHVVNPGIGYTLQATVPLTLLSEGSDHVTIECVPVYMPGETLDQIKHNLTVSINGTAVNFGGGTLTNALYGFSPVEFHFSMMYGCSITVKDMVIRPYISSYQHFLTIPSVATAVTRYAINRTTTSDVAITSVSGNNGLTLQNGGSAILKSYKMLSGEYKFLFFKPPSGATTMTFFLNADMKSTGPYNSLYVTVPSDGGNYTLRRSYEDDTLETLFSNSCGPLTVNTWYELRVKVNDVNHSVQIALYEQQNYANIVFNDLISNIAPTHFKYGKIGFKSSGASVFLYSYTLYGVEKFGRGPQIKKYVDDFDFGPIGGELALLTKEYNDNTAQNFVQDLTLGVVKDPASPVINGWRILRPNRLRPYVCDAECLVKSTATTTGVKKAGMMFNVTDFTTTQNPLNGYGAFINFYTKEVEIVIFDKETAPTNPSILSKQSITDVTISDNKIYRLTASRHPSAIYVLIEDYDGNAQLFTTPLNVTNMKRFDQNGYTALATWYATGQSGIQFDDFIIQNIDFYYHRISLVSLGGINHGGEYDLPMKVSNKVNPGYTIPYGYYYMVANAGATSDNTPVTFSIKNFGKNTNIVTATPDGSDITSNSFTVNVNKIPSQFAKYIIKLDTAHTNDNCGIEIITSTATEYQPTIFMNYIINVPLSGRMGKQMFINETEIIAKSPSIIYRRLEKKKIS